MIKEKRKQIEQELRDPSISLDHIGSPPSRHEKWMRVCQRPGDKFTLEATHLVPDKILIVVNSIC